MPLSPLDLAGAKSAVETLLAELDLDAFLFAVEHTPRGWELHLECAAIDGWLAETILLGDELPSPSASDGVLRERLLGLLRQRLTECKRRR